MVQYNATGLGLYLKLYVRDYQSHETSRQMKEKKFLTSQVLLQPVTW